MDADKKQTRRVIIHAGWPKTGTSSLQNLLYKNRKELLRKTGYLYPSIAAEQGYMMAMMFSSNAKSHPKAQRLGISSDADIKRLSKTFTRQFDMELVAKDWSTWILSDEGLVNFSVADLKKIKKWVGQYVDEIDIYFLARSPQSYSPSVSQEYIKIGQTLDQVYKSLHRPHYGVVLSRFIEVFGQDSVHVQDFDVARKHKKGLIAYFMDEWGIPNPLASKLIRRAKSDNQSLSMLGAEILSKMNEINPRIVDGKMNEKRTPIELHYLRQIAGPKYRLPDEINKKLSEATKNDRDWIADKFGVKFDTDIRVGGSDAKDYNISPETTESLANLFSDMIREIYDLRQIVGNRKKRAGKLGPDNQQSSTSTP